MHAINDRILGRVLFLSVASTPPNFGTHGDVYFRCQRRYKLSGMSGSFERSPRVCWLCEWGKNSNVVNIDLATLHSTPRFPLFSQITFWKTCTSREKKFCAAVPQGQVRNKVRFQAGVVPTTSLFICFFSKRQRAAFHVTHHCTHMEAANKHIFVLQRCLTLSAELLSWRRRPSSSVRRPLTPVSRKPLYGSRPNFMAYLQIMFLFFQNFKFSKFYNFFFRFR